jgi:threonine/homoserine/homoserine lactone efflux protein
MTTALASGALLGLFCGLAPGPLLALVLAQTLRHGPREGCKIALTPLVTDAPVIALALALAAKMEQLRLLLGIVSIAGGAFVLYLAWEGFRPVRVAAEAPAEQPRSWFKGILTNLLNPHPWLFWMTVGAATLAKAMAQSWPTAVAFLPGGDARPSRAAGLLCAPAVPGGMEKSWMISLSSFDPYPADQIPAVLCRRVHCQI